MSFPRQEKPTATNALPTLSTRLPSIRKARKARPLREEDVTTENNLVMEDKPNPSSEKKPKPPRKSPSDCNATCAKQEDVLWWAEPNQWSSWILNKSESKESERVTLSSNDCSIFKLILSTCLICPFEEIGFIDMNQFLADKA